MAYTIEKVTVWSGTVKDRPGGLAEKLNVLTEAGANLEFLSARRARRGTGMVFMAPIKGARRMQAAKSVGLAKSDELHRLRVEGPDKPGLGAIMANAIADEGINLRGLSAATIGKRCIVYMAFDTVKDVAKGRQVLKKVLPAK